MSHSGAESAKNTAQNNVKRGAASDDSAAEATLDTRYRKIGISAVAAAARYLGTAKNPAYAPAPINWDDRAEDTAA